MAPPVSCGGAGRVSESQCTINVSQCLRVSMSQCLPMSQRLINVSMSLNVSMFLNVSMSLNVALSQEPVPGPELLRPQSAQPRVASGARARAAPTGANPFQKAAPPSARTGRAFETGRRRPPRGAINSRSAQHSATAAPPPPHHSAVPVARQLPRRAPRRRVIRPMPPRRARGPGV